MATILRSGRGSSVRLKLLVTLLWVGAAPPHDLSYPARVWAQLLGLREPAGNGARQVRSSLRWLHAHEFVSLSGEQGRAPTARLLEENLSGRPYTVPGSIVGQLPSGEDRKPHLYINMPAAFWENGWVASLSGAAVAMLLVLLDAQAGQPDGTETWFSPRVAEERYGLSEGTRSSGLAELADEGLITVGLRPVARDAAGFQRMRRTYKIALDRLGSAPLLRGWQPAVFETVDGKETPSAGTPSIPSSEPKGRRTAAGLLWPQPALEKLAASRVTTISRLGRIMDVLASHPGEALSTSELAARTDLQRSEIRSVWVNLGRHLNKHYDGLAWPVRADWGPDVGLPRKETYYMLLDDQAQRWRRVRGRKLGSAGPA